MRQDITKRKKIIMHPDVKKALAMLTKHARMAGAAYHFPDMLKEKELEHQDAEGMETPLKMPSSGEKTPGKALDERVKEVALEQDMGHAYPYEHEEPDGDEDILGNEPPGAEEEDSGDEHVPQMPPMRLGIVTSREKTLAPVPARSHGIDESAKKRRGRPRGSKL